MNSEEQVERIERWLMIILTLAAPPTCWYIWHCGLLGGTGPAWGWVVIVLISLCDGFFTAGLAILAGPTGPRRFFVKHPSLTRAYEVPADALGWSLRTEARLRDLGFSIRANPATGDIEFERFKDGMAGFLNLSFEGSIHFDTSGPAPVAHIMIKLRDTVLFDSCETHNLGVIADYLAGQRDDVRIRVYPGLVSASVLDLLVAHATIHLNTFYPATFPLWLPEMLALVSAGGALIAIVQMLSKKQKQFIGYTNAILCVLNGLALLLTFIITRIATGLAVLD